MMKNSDDAIGKVLGGLRDAEAPVGIERRILHGLEERAAGRARSGWRAWLPIWVGAPRRSVRVGSLVCGVALAGVVAVGVRIPAVRRLGRAPAQVSRSPAATGPVVLGTSQAGALGTSQTGAKSARPALSRADVRAVAEIKMPRKASAGNVEAVLDSDAAAVDDMHAASRPAPPMPLTEQERLLLRLVHKDDPVELAMLDPRARALQDLEDKADFQRFFGQQTKRAVPEPSVTEPSLTQQQGVPPESTMEGAAPAQPAEGATPEQVAPEQPAQQPSTPEKFAPDESTTQQATPGTTRTTGENE